MFHIIFFLIFIKFNQSKDIWNIMSDMIKRFNDFHTYVIENVVWTMNNFTQTYEEQVHFISQGGVQFVYEIMKKNENDKYIIEPCTWVFVNIIQLKLHSFYKDFITKDFLLFIFEGAKRARQLKKY